VQPPAHSGFGFLGLLLLRRRFFFLLLFLVTGFSAVLDLWQQLTNELDVLPAPSVDAKTAKVDDLGCRHLPDRNVVTEGLGSQAQHLSGLTRGETIHSNTSVLDSFEDVKPQFLPDVRGQCFHNYAKLPTKARPEGIASLIKLAKGGG